MLLRIAGIEPESLVDGYGIRFVIFTQGCRRLCPGCHNPQTHALDGGRLVDTEELTREILGHGNLDGITFSGGEPFLQAEACREIAREVRSAGVHVAAYTGYTLEELVADPLPGARALLALIDWLVDGPFLEEERDLSLPFRGSRNQRIREYRQIQAALDAIDATA